MAVVLTPVQTKQIRINIHKRNNTKNTVPKIQNILNTSTPITKTPTHYKTHTYTNPHITKQVKTTTVQDVPGYVVSPIIFVFYLLKQNYASGLQSHFENCGKFCQV